MTRHRWFRFGAVGAVGALVQLLALAAMRPFMHYLWATGLAVEFAVLHNYVWHRRWTWANRSVAAGSLWRFHLGNGFLSLLGNLFWMRILTGALHVPVIPANIAAIGLMTIFNFVIGDRWVFAGEKS